MPDSGSKSNRVAEIDTELRKRIKSIRLRQGTTQAEVAAKLGIVPQQYHKYESGVLRLSAGMVSQISEVLECSLMDIFPAADRDQSRLEVETRVDILKQEVSAMVLDIGSEDVLTAIKTLLAR